MTVKLSDGEKLILVMLSDIYKHLKIQGEIDPRFVLDAVTSGNHWGLEWKYSGIFGAEATHEKTVRETSDILNMFRMLERSYADLPNPEKKRIEKEAAPFGDDVKFGGFDANNEPHYGIAGFLIEQLDSYQELKGRPLNSHSPTIDSYRRMLEVFTPMMLPFPHNALSANQIIKVLKAQVHPTIRE